MKTWPDLQSSNPDYLIVRRWYQACLAHKTKPIWIVRYKATEYRAKHFQAYRACEPCDVAEKHPCKGGINNKRIGTDRGFKTLTACLNAVNMLEWP